MTTTDARPLDAGTIDQSTLEAFQQRTLGRFVDAGVTLMIDLGYRTGLFEAAAQGPALTTSSGGIEHILALRTAGAVLGELAVADGGPRSATAVATTPVEALAVPAARFRAFLTDHPAATLELLTIAIGRLRAADRQRAEFGCTDTITRLVRTLGDLARSHGRAVEGGVRLDLLSQDDLAALCGSSREAVRRSLGTLRAAGLVTTGRRSVTILDIDGIDAWTV